MTTPTLFTAENDFDSLVFRWLLLEKEAPVMIVRDAEPTLDMPPPYFVERDLHLFDHWVLLQYFQERYPGEVLMPIDPVTRGQIRQVCVLLREWSGDTERELFDLLGGYPYLLGNNFTLADIYAGSRLEQIGAHTARTKAYAERLGRRKALQEAR